MHPGHSPRPFSLLPQSARYSPRPRRFLPIIILHLLQLTTTTSLTLSTRRQALQHASGAALTTTIFPSTTIGTETSTPPSSAPASAAAFLTLKKKSLTIPTVGYSLYKTAPSQAARGTSIALASGVRHFDVATSYESNSHVGDVLDKFIRNGSVVVDDNAAATVISRGGNPRRRRRDIFVNHKVSNAEQSTDESSVTKAVKDEMVKLKLDYLDMCSIHSPLTDERRRLATYAALSSLVDEGLVKSVGVCNYGVKALDEIIDAGFESPSVIQLELSPFNQHKDVQSWALDRDAKLCCSAWSKLSGVTGPQEGWTTVANMAKEKGVTKAQILVKWALLKGFICVPRSGTGSKVERIAIAENSYGGVRGFSLSVEELTKLDSLDEGLKAGRLGRRDGWGDDDVRGDEWDPTDFL